MKYNLEKIDEILHDIITNLNSKWNDNTVQPTLNDELKKESIRYRREIKTTVFKLKSNNQIEHYIHKQQLALENLIVVTVREINAEQRKDLYIIGQVISKTEQLKTIYIKLEKLQLFLENEYAKYLDLDRLIPYRSFLKRRKALTSKVETIRTYKTTAELSFVFLEIICKQLNIKYKKGISYNQSNYNSEFISELFLLLTNENEVVSDKIIVAFLVEMNYNSKVFFKFQTGKISEELSKISSERDKIDYLFRIIKTYNQIIPIGRSSYNKKRISHREQIVNWVEEKINYMSQSFVRKKPNLTLSTTLPENKTKILLNLSVAQVSYFFNLMHLVGIIKHKNQRDIFRFIAENFKTANTENISTISISSKYYNPESSTQEAVKSKVIEMLNILKKQN